MGRIYSKAAEDVKKNFKLLNRAKREEIAMMKGWRFTANWQQLSRSYGHATVTWQSLELRTSRHTWRLVCRNVHPCECTDSNSEPRA